jgi:hypothetical protein
MKKIAKKISIAALLGMFTLAFFVSHSGNAAKNPGDGPKTTCYFDQVGNCDSGGWMTCGLGYCD